MKPHESEKTAAARAHLESEVSAINTTRDTFEIKATTEEAKSLLARLQVQARVVGLASMQATAELRMECRKVRNLCLWEGDLKGV
eukprot:2278401-Pyramimonas_sp.AAC.1